MSSPQLDETKQYPSNDAAPVRPRPADWFWRPWYAKLWWAAIPLYWLPAGGPTRIDALQVFYKSGWALVPNLLLLPITALLFLGFGYFRELLAIGSAASDWYDYDAGEPRRAGFPHPTMDEFDPRSGPLWIGNRPVD